MFARSAAYVASPLMFKLNEDVFSCILSHISDTKALHIVLTALPASHLLFPAALTRLWQLPLYLDSYDSQASAASQKVLDYLLGHGAGHRALAECVHHLVVSVEHKPTVIRGPGYRIRPNLTIPADTQALHKRLPELFRRTVNLESLEYHSFPGIDLKSEHVDCLRDLERLHFFAVDCALRSRENEIPAAGGDYAAPGALSAEYDAENWEMEPFLSTVGPKITSLNLRYVNQTMFTALTSRTDLFASYHALEHLKIDLTEGVWDWGGGGSPAMGASAAFTFPCLGFPSVERFELIVCDKTLSGPHKGPLNLVHCRLLMELSIDVRYSIWWQPFETIKLFEALSPLDFPALTHLEIKDNTRNTLRYYWDRADNLRRWEHRGRIYTELVTSFLGAIHTGALTKLTTLWVDEKVLVPAGLSVQDLLGVDDDTGSSFPPAESAHHALWKDALGTALK
ncbi:hypothetical protein B0H19DRAFT_83577, partial [Mycena capillaripes]